MCVCACLCVKSLNIQLQHTVRVRITELVSLIAAPRRKHRLAARLPLAACWWACRAPVVTNFICGAASSGPRPPRYQASTTRLLLAHARATRLPAPARRGWIQPSASRFYRREREKERRQETERKLRRVERKK